MVDRAWIRGLSITSLVVGCILEAVGFILFLSRFRSPCTFSVCDVGPAVFYLPVTIACLGTVPIFVGAVGFYVLRDARSR